MASRQRSACVSVLCLAWLAAASSAQASCNVIPDLTQSFSATPQGQQVAETIPSDLSYRGAFGRIDGPLLAGDSSVTLGADDHCLAERATKQISKGGYRLGALQAMILYEPLGAAPQALFYSSADGCDKIRRKFARHERVQLLGCEDARKNLEISVPERGRSERVTLKGSPNARPGAVTVVVISAAKDPVVDFHLDYLIRGDCAGLGADFGTDPEKHFCIDTIYDDYASRCEITPIYAAVVPSNLLSLPPKNVFQEQCIDPVSPDSTLESCAATPTELAFAEDDSGNVYIPFDYTKIRMKKDGTGSITRVLTGLTATSRKEKGKDPRIVIPGREFLGSTPYGDPNGSVTDWRKPDIDIYELSDRPEEIGLKGTVDKDDSIIHVRPRLPVGWRCDSLFHDGEACMGVEDYGSGGVEECADQDRFGATCIPLSEPEYAACSGGAFDGMPCTRPAHCPGLFAACNATPKCQKKDEVWEPGKNTGTTECTVQSDCKTSERCGFALFDLHDRKTENLVYKVEKGAGKKVRRGVCENDKAKSCSSAPNGNSCSGDATCVGYHLEAHGQE